jgi:hypothetical protein
MACLTITSWSPLTPTSYRQQLTRGRDPLGPPRIAHRV